jgi:N-acetylmuramoyl-L-alanine amidase
MYEQATQREDAVRAALSAPEATPAMLIEVRAVVSVYEAIVKHYSTSGYSDNALWQAGRLSLDAYTKFGQPRDRDTGVSLLRRLATVYNTSKLAKQVPEQLALVGIRSGSEASRAGTSLQAGPASPPAAPARITSPPPAPVSNVDPASTRAPKIATIKDIRRSVTQDSVRVTIELDAEVPFHDERIGDPSRVFVDLPGTRAAPALLDQTLRFDLDADIVRQIRIGRHANNVTRVVLDANGMTSYSVYPLYSPYRLVIDCVRLKIAATATEINLSDVPAVSRLATQPAPPIAVPRAATQPAQPIAVSHATTQPPLPIRAVATNWTRRLPSMRRRPLPPVEPARVTGDAAVPTLDATPTIAAASPMGPIAQATTPTRNLGGGFSIARQLGLGVSRIVIDAGHGGHDPGAHGKGVTEAELVLDIALRVEKLLQKTPGVEVILTRRTDEFIPLQERTAIANREGADLFLSIHANASPSPQARGIETYFLNFANNLSAASVAARENAASGQAMGALPDLVKSIALNNKLDESRDFATQVQRAMLERLRVTNKTVKDLGVKQAPFVVLIGAAMPSVLAEISFVTNTQEARLLKSNAYRQRIADALFNAIRNYQTSLRNVTTVAHQ